MSVLPFLSYKNLPSQIIIKENIRPDHVKEDLDILVHALTPILFMIKPGVPKPPFLDPNSLQPLTDKPGTLSILNSFGWLPNHQGNYVFVNANSQEETNRREEIVNEFRQFYNELKKTKETDVTSLENSHTMITTIPFSSYQIIPADKIIRDNVNSEHINEHLDSMIHTLTPVLYVTKSGVPKPPFLDPSIIEQLTNKPGTLNLLPLFGCSPNSRGDYVFINAQTSDAQALRDQAAQEFRQFYDEIKKVKNNSTIIMEYFLNHPTIV